MNALYAGLLASLLLCSGSACAADNVLLIQNGPNGFVVWHTEGQTSLPDDDILEIMATAQPGGGAVVASPLGAARAFELEHGIRIDLPEAATDRALLIDRDACGHIKVWHAEGATQLSEAELTEIVLSALPGGGPRMQLGERYAKAFIDSLGITVTLWNIPPKKAGK